jgi:hypothetical protein
MSMKIEKTERGFQRIDFKDIYGVECSLQESSLADRAAVWFGPNEPNPRRLVPGQSWQPVPFPEGTLCDTRAHLGQEQVKELIGYLQNWLKSGRFDKPRKIKVHE